MAFARNIIKIEYIFIATLLNPSISYAESLNQIYDHLIILDHAYPTETYGIPINIDTNKAPIKKLYLVGSDIDNNEIILSGVKKRDPRIEVIHDRAVYSGRKTQHIAISTKNYKYLDKYLYHIVKAKSRDDYLNKFKDIEKLMLSNFPSQYGFQLDKLTNNLCNDKPGNNYFIVENMYDRLYYYNASCMTGEDRGNIGKEFSILFRINNENKLSIIWKYEVANYQKTDRKRQKINYRFIADFDQNNKPEVLINKQAARDQSNTYLVELDGSEGENIIKNLFRHFEGEATRYMEIEQYTKMIYGESQ